MPLHGPFFNPWCSDPQATQTLPSLGVASLHPEDQAGMPPSPSQAGLSSLEYKGPTAGTAGAGEWAAQPQACCDN